MHQETYTKKLEHRAWEGRLVGYSMDSKSYRIYNAETRRVRESRNVVFIDTPSIVPPPSPDVGGYDEAASTYASHDDMVRDVQNYMFNQSLDAHSPSQAVGNPGVAELLDLSSQTTGGGGSGPAGDEPGGDDSAPPGGVIPPAPGGGVPPPTSSSSGVPGRGVGVQRVDVVLAASVHAASGRRVVVVRRVDVAPVVNEVLRLDALPPGRS